LDMKYVSVLNFHLLNYVNKNISKLGLKTISQLLPVK
jgi:hypothetical protein